MRLGLCQIDATVGDFEGNGARILQAARQVHGQGATLAVFSELTLCGYPPRDLLDRRGFLAGQRERLSALAQQLPAQLSTLVGFVDTGRDGDRELRFNAAALLRGGQLAQVFHKRLLPTYDVFDETRYFEPGRLPQCFEHEGVRVGVTICEDAWNDADSPLRVRYPHNPVAECVAAGAQVLLNLAASPFTLSKREQRSDMFAHIARQHSRPLAVVNLVGGNDDLLFDGSSALYGPQGELLARAADFEEDVVAADLQQGGRCAQQASSAAAAALGALVMGTRDYARKCGFKRAVVGLSGGIDSSLVAAIAARALPPQDVLGVAMPTRYSSEGSRRDARALSEALGIGYREISIDRIFQSYLDELGPELAALGPAGENDVTFENLQARIRGNTLMAISNRRGHLLLTTGNKSEIAVGYCTLYGDMAGGLAVVSDLPKTFVYEVSREVNRQAGRDVIPQSVLDKPPSAELRPDQVDQDSLPPYDVLDAVLERLVEEHRSPEAIVAEGYDAATVHRVASMVRRNEYKRRQMPPGLIVTRKAFGPGRRYPIAQRFDG